MLKDDVGRWSPHRRKGMLVFLVLVLTSTSMCNVPKDFEQAPLNDDIDTILEEEALLSIPRNNNNSQRGNRFKTSKAGKYVEEFTQLSHTYDSSINLLSEDAMYMSDILPSEYNLLQERSKREVFEGSANDDECSDPNICNGDHEVCTDLDMGYDCSCEEGYTRDNGQCFTALLRSGSDAGDDSMPARNEYYRYIYISDGIAFGSKTYYKLYISLNGVISFDRRYGSYYPSLFTGSQNILCPYWADIDLSGGKGNVYYQTYTRKDSFSISAMNQASAKFQQCANVDNFNPTWMLVVTWDKVHQRRYFQDSGDDATFQLVLASDGQSTRVMYIYNRMSWIPRQQAPVVIGYQSSYYNDRRRWRHPVSARTAIYNSQDIGSNSQCPGVYYFNVGGEVINYAALCYNWYDSFVRDYYLFQSFFWRLPSCGCNGFFMWWDRRYRLSSWSWTGRVCFTSRFSRRFQGLSRECCYRRWWSFLEQDSGNAWRYHPWWNSGAHYRADLLGKQYCCEKSNMCHLYREIRPRKCYSRFPFRWAWAFGDPHITTLDDKTYIFNGWGEYTMIETPRQLSNSDGDELDPFLLQARTNRATNKDGVITDATIFTAFAATDFSNDTFYVELSPSSQDGEYRNTHRTVVKVYRYTPTVNANMKPFKWLFPELIIYRNGKDVSVAFRNDANFTETDDQGGLSVSRENDDVVGVFASGITVRIIKGPKLLTVSVGMQSDYDGQLRGLMGNFNGDNTDDFIFPNGTSLPDSSTEATLYQYGQAWHIKPEESYMRYPERKNASDFSHPEFTPLFLDEKTDAERAEAVAACGGDDTNLPCIFDFLATGDEDIAASTKLTDSTAASDRLEQSNTAPDVSSNTTILHATLNQEIVFALNASDADTGDTISYDFIDQPGSGFTYAESDDASGERIALVKWTPENSDPTKISVLVQDKKNASSSPVDIEIRLCDGCSGNGECDFETTRTGANDDVNTAFQLAACICNTGWTGANCSEDIDGCEEEPCFEGQDCTDLPPGQQVDFDRLRNCSACPDGFTADEDKCEDVDECETNNGNCAQACSNTEGSFTCTCNDGYRKVGEECQDINECVEALHDCEQNCNNNEGGFTCSCEDTYYLDTDNSSCLLNTSALDPCGGLTCEYGCRTVEGVAVCFCPSGYYLNTTDNSTCEDTNECDQNVCAQTCNNTDGSFQCSCFDGFILADDKLSCSECSEPLYGKDCGLRCDCGDRYSECDNVRGCICNDGWRGVKCDVDVDECDENPNICQSKPGTICNNVDGSYECNCPAGFEKQDDGSCQDINECETDANTCSQECNNVAGSFTCSCRSGYQRSGTTACEDVDECEADQNDCDQICNNVVGSYNCDCNFGYRLTDDRVSCEQVEDVCRDVKNLNCSQGCTVDADNEEAFCFCNLGYRLGSDKQTCIDVIECDDTTLNKCTQNCVNTIGSFNCSCNVGYELSNDKVTCNECDSEHWGVGCMEECGCGIGADTCNNERGCVCKTGWLGVKCDQDRDECSDVTTSCPENSECVNTPGSYRCQCSEGYSLNTTDNTCQNIDECTDSNPCDQICTDTVGSFSCTCREGFTRTNDKCENVDECETGKNDCEHLCRDTEGSYACYCRPGFVLSVADRRSCIPELECQTTTDCSQGCQVDNSAETCFCNSGYKLDTDGKTCVDVDECTAATDPCTDSRATCINIVNGGGYECKCEDGTRLQSDGVSCIDCDLGEYGENCESDCTCVIANTEDCVRFNGTCVCKKGWEGDNCQTDINECTTVDCGDNAQCENNDGGYMCACDAGFFRSGDTCEACDGSRWGSNCANLCTCGINSVSCNATNGDCTCTMGWEGTDCTTDLDECTADSTICDSTPNSECDNNDGGYTCKCKEGYLLNPDTGTCDNLDECLQGKDDCKQECTDTEGNYTCSCSAGYTGSGNNCNDIDECDDTTICDDVPNSTCDNNPLGTYTCKCDNGYEKNSTTGLCQDQDECALGTDNCIQECVNTDGSYQCSCSAGYTGNGNTCIDINECDDTTICDSVANSTCDNNPLGSYTCKCDDGFVKNTTTELCQDIDECTTTPTICESTANTDCSNTIGSHECVCRSGYFLNTTSNICEDTDECADTTACDSVPNSSCVNTAGSFDCACEAGYRKNTTTNLCPDIDECSENPAICDSEVNSECDNLAGSHSCICKLGYVRNTTSDICEDIDECGAGSDGCEYQCVNMGGSFRCDCPADQVLGINNKTCDPVVVIFAVVRLSGTLTNSNPTSLTYKTLKTQIENELFAYYRQFFGDAFVTVVVIALRSGSIVAEYNTTVNSNIKPNAKGDFVKASGDLINTNITVGGAQAVVQGVTINGQNVSADLCQAYQELESCGTNRVCLLTDGTPSCNVLPQGDDFRVVLGLSIGIPLFLAAVGTIIVVLIIKNRKGKGKDTSFDDNGNGEYVKPFASQLAKRDTFYNMNRGNYLPYSPSVSSGSDHGSRRKPMRGSSFRWNNTEPKDTRRPYDNADDSHFSWDFLYRVMTPNEQFQIRRPQVGDTPNLTRSSRKNPYSSA